MKLFREQAINIIASINLIIDYDIKKREDILTSIYSENDEYENILDFSDPKYNNELLVIIVDSYVGIKNSHIASEISKILHEDIHIIDQEDYSLQECLCCNYRTIYERGNYEVCPVCFWEDDGFRGLNEFSPANHMTLEQAKINFSEFRAVSENLYDPNNLASKKYHKS